MYPKYLPTVVFVASCINTLVLCLHFDEPCQRQPDQCDKMSNLVCSEIAAGVFTCQCDLGISFPNPNHPEICVRFALIPGNPCIPDTDQCQTVLGTECVNNVNGNEFTCECSESSGYFEYPIGIKCTDFGKLHDECIINERFCEKLEGTSCIGFEAEAYCLCDPAKKYTEHPDEKTCLPDLLVGQSCVQNSHQCDNIQGGSVAICSEQLGDSNNFVCQCIKDYFEYKNVCIPLPIAPGYVCGITDHCTGIVGSECVISENDLFRCECIENAGFFEYPLNLKCTEFAELNDECIPGERFCEKIEGSKCLNNQTTSFCLCDENSNFTQSPDGSNCLIDKMLGEICVPDSYQCDKIEGGAICLPNVETSGLTCQCKEKYIEVGGNCRPIPEKPGDVCGDPQHCLNVLNSQCECDPICSCQCLSEYDVEDVLQQCVLRATLIGQECLSNQQCQNLNNTQCVLINEQHNYRACTCTPNFVVSNSSEKCLPIQPVLASPCEESSQCSMTNSVCDPNSKVCTCRVGFVDNNLRECLQILSEIGDTCVADLQCTPTLGDASECRGTCQCKTNTILFNRKCYNKTFLGDRCQSNDECLATIGNFTECQADICQCNGDAFEITGICFTELFVGSSCANDIQCNSTIIGNSFCSSKGRCSCLIAESPSYDLRQCNNALPINVYKFNYNIFIGIVFLYSINVVFRV